MFNGEEPNEYFKYAIDTFLPPEITSTAEEKAGMPCMLSRKAWRYRARPKQRRKKKSPKLADKAGVKLIIE